MRVGRNFDLELREKFNKFWNNEIEEAIDVETALCNHFNFFQNHENAFIMESKTLFLSLDEVKIFLD